MQHVRRVSRAPHQASNALCTNPQSDLQVKLCFLVSVLTEFLLPVYSVKGNIVNPPQDPNE